MPSFTLDATIKVVDEVAFDRVLKDFVEREMKRAVRAFLKACLARIPVQTGFLTGAFSEINKAFAVNYLQDINPALAKIVKNKDFIKVAKLPAIHPSKISSTSARANTRALIEHRKKNLRLLQTKAKRKLLKGQYYYPGDGESPILKTPTSGVQFATAPGDIIKVTPEGATFTLNVDISYYRINDFYAKISGAPWNSLDAGAMAMTNSLEEAVNRFPDIDYILADLTIQLRGTQITTKQDKAQTVLLQPFNEE
jgi:hypothetical protein